MYIKHSLIKYYSITLFYILCIKNVTVIHYIIAHKVYI